MIGADQVDIDIARPEGGIGFHQRADRLDHAGVVDQDLRFPEPPNGFIDHSRDAGIISNIAGARAGLAAVSAGSTLRLNYSIAPASGSRMRVRRYRWSERRLSNFLLAMRCSIRS